MVLDIRCNGLKTSEAIREHTERRLHFALGRFPFVSRATVRLGDVNGPRGGIDKCCRITLSLAGGNRVTIEDVDRDLYVAVDRATERAGRVAGRRRARTRTSTRRSYDLAPLGLAG